MPSWNDGLRKVVAATLVAASASAVVASSAQAGNLFTTIGITNTNPETRANGQIRGGWTFPGQQMPASNTRVVPGNDASDDVPLLMPDTTGNRLNMAAFRGQPFTIKQDQQKAYTRLHFFGATADGSGGGPATLRFADGATEQVTVNFPDWCGNPTAPTHIALGRFTGRNTTSGGMDGAQCAIFHVTTTVSAANAGKTLTSIVLPAGTNGTPNGTTQAYLMSLTAETAAGVFETFDISASDQFPNDQAAPTTTAEITSDAEQSDGWYRGAISVKLTGADAGDGSAGVEQIQYRIDGGTTQTTIVTRDTATLTVPVDLEGPHVFEYRSIDGVGNTEPFKSVAVRIDRSAPSTTPLPGTAYGVEGWYDGPVAVNFLAGDGAGSGIAKVEWRYQGDTDWQQATDGVGVIDRSGSNVVEYRATDKLGNVETTKTLDLKVDAKAPVSTLVVNGAAPAPTYTTPVRLTFTREDGEGIGAVGTEYRINGGAWTEYTDAFDLTANGGYRVDFRSRDRLGNVELYQSYTLTLAIPIVTPNVLQALSTARPAAFVSLGETPSRLRTRSALRNGRFAVNVTCQSVDSSTVSLTVSKATAKRLKLKSTTLAKRTVACGNEGRGTATLAPSATVKRALARYKRSFEATLKLTAPGQASDSAELTIR